MLFYSATTNGFYDSDIHGQRKLMVMDPAFTPPMITVADPGFVVTESDPEAKAPMIEVPDYTVQAPLISVTNPDCLVPADAVEITKEDHLALLDGQLNGWLITNDGAGNPVLMQKAEEPMTFQRLAPLRNAVQAHMDELAQGAGFDGMADALSYTTSTLTNTKAKAKALLAWRDEVKTFTTEQYAAFLSGNGGIAIPTAEEFVQALPATPTLD